MNNVLIDRIQKMLALAKSAREIGSVEEAATAISLAQKLMVENKIAMSDLSDLDAEEVSIIEYDVLFEEGGKSPRTWKWDLLSGIAKNNFCEVLKFSAAFFVGQSPGTGMLPGKLLLLGKRSDVEAVLYMYRWLAREIDKLAKRFGNDFRFFDPILDGSKRTWMDCFRKGAAIEVSRILAIKRVEQERHLRKEQTMALVRADDDVSDYIKGKFKISHKKQNVSNWSDSGYKHGRDAAHGIDLSDKRGLKAPSKQLR